MQIPSSPPGYSAYANVQPLKTETSIPVEVAPNNLGFSDDDRAEFSPEALEASNEPISVPDDPIDPSNGGSGGSGGSGGG